MRCAACPSGGRQARLDEQQRAALRAALLQSPTAHGLGTELWTLKRVSAVIERMLGPFLATVSRLNCCLKSGVHFLM